MQAAGDDRLQLAGQPEAAVPLWEVDERQAGIELRTEELGVSVVAGG